MALNSCSHTPPVYDEGILTMDAHGFLRAVDLCLAGSSPRECVEVAMNRHFVADFRGQNGKSYEKSGLKLDGHYLYTVEDRSNILSWAAVNCK